MREHPTSPLYTDLDCLSGSRSSYLGMKNRFQWGCAISFLSSLLGGQNKTLSSDMNQFGQIAGFSTSQGETDIGNSSKFLNSILSGDSSKISQTLAPQIGQAKTSAQQDAKTRTEFGSRSGGTAASNNASGDKAHSDITSMIASLTGKAAESLGSEGAGLLSQGQSAFGNQLEASQIQMKNWADSIGGLGITKAAGAAEGAGLAALGM